MARTIASSAVLVAPATPAVLLALATSDCSFLITALLRRLACCRSVHHLGGAEAVDGPGPVRQNVCLATGGRRCCFRRGSALFPKAYERVLDRLRSRPPRSVLPGQSASVRTGRRTSPGRVRAGCDAALRLQAADRRCVAPFIAGKSGP